MPSEIVETLQKPTVNATDLAVQRTIMAAERTLMSWTRTSISLISFGFTIYKFLEYMLAEGKAKIMINPNGPKNFGIALILIGIFSLIISSIQYRSIQKKLMPGKKLIFSLSFAVAWSILLLGLLALTNILFKIGPF